MAVLHKDNTSDDFRDGAGNLVDEFMALDDLRQGTDFAKCLAELIDEGSIAGDGALALLRKLKDLKDVNATQGD